MEAIPKNRARDQGQVKECLSPTYVYIPIVGQDNKERYKIKGRETKGWPGMYIRQRRLQTGPKVVKSGVLRGKKVVQFQNGISKK